MRRDSRLLGTAASALAALTLLAVAGPSATAGSNDRPPKVVFAEFGENPKNESEYRFRAGVQRAKSVVVKLRRSPAEGRTKGRREVIKLNKVKGSSAPKVWIGFTSKNRRAPCYRAAYIARNPYGRDAIAHRLCIFGHGGDEAVRVEPW